MKDSYQLSASILQQLPIPSLVFEDIAIDLITRFPSSKGESTIITIVDRLSKYGHLIAIPFHLLLKSFKELL